jgi:hypothetical protein
VGYWVGIRFDSERPCFRFYSGNENLVLWARSEINGSALEDCVEKTQIPSTKFQLNLKFQYLMTKTYQGKFVSGGLDIRILVIGICLIFGI